jgi:hypothetical protein
VRVGLYVLSCGTRHSFHSTVIRYLASDFLHPSCNPFEGEVKEAVVYVVALILGGQGAVK